MGIKGKRQRQQRQQQQQHLLFAETAEELSLPSSSSSLSSSTSTNSSPKSSTDSLSPSSSPSSSSSSTLQSDEMSSPVFRNILLCSIGNPGNLSATRHSAAHMLLPLLASSSTLSQSRPHGGLVAPGPSSDTYSTTLFQSPSYMNLSGGAVAKAWKHFNSTLQPDEKKNSVLVILHDELERQPGAVKYKKDGSAGGHNGLSSIKQNISGGTTVHKIGLGIGRPDARESKIVADYVLQKMPRKERDAMEERGLPVVLEMLRKIGEGELK